MFHFLMLEIVVVSSASGLQWLQPCTSAVEAEPAVYFQTITNSRDKENISFVSRNIKSRALEHLMA